MLTVTKHTHQSYYHCCSLLSSTTSIGGRILIGELLRSPIGIVTSAGMSDAMRARSAEV